jgi:hypothetical protein
MSFLWIVQNIKHRVENSIVLHITLQSLNIFRAFQIFEMPHIIFLKHFPLHPKGTC